MNDFRKILGVPLVTSPAGSLDPLAGLRPSTSIPGPAVSLPAVSAAIKPAVPNVQLGAIGGLGNAFNAPQNESAPSAFAVPVPQPVIQPRVLIPKSPDFSAPQRRF